MQWTVNTFADLMDLSMFDDFLTEEQIVPGQTAGDKLALIIKNRKNEDVDKPTPDFLAHIVHHCQFIPTMWSLVMGSYVAISTLNR